MIKILHLNNYISHTSGVTRYIYSLIKNTTDYFQHEVICLGGDAIDLFLKHNIKVTVLEYSKITSILNIYAYLWKYISQNKFNIIHSHHRLFDTVTSFISNNKCKKVTTVHSKVFGHKKISYKSDKIISVSNAITDHLIQYYRIPENRIVRMKNFVDRNEIKTQCTASELKTRLNISDKKVILFVGRFSEEKGVDILIRVYKEIQMRNKNISLVMIGEGDQKEKLVEYSVQNKLPVCFIAPHENIFEYYMIADVVVLPSRVDPFPYVMLEAGIMRKPFIGSNVDGIPELIINNFNGLLFNKENYRELLNAIMLTLTDSTLAENLAKKLFNGVIQSYTAEKIIPVYISFYNSLV